MDYSLACKFDYFHLFKWTFWIGGGGTGVYVNRLSCLDARAGIILLLEAIHCHIYC
jgi:hypothetical protein